AGVNERHLVRELRVFRAVALEALRPVRARGVTARADALREARAHGLGNEKLRVLGPAVGALGESHLFLAQRLAVRLGTVLLVRRAPADVTVEDDPRRL